MKQLVRIASACILLFACSLQASTPAVSIIGGPNGVTTAAGPILVGWKFSVTRPLSVDSLGFYTDCNSIFDVPVPTAGDIGLWDANSSLLRSCTVLQTDAIVNGFKYHSISPVTLQPGQNYVLGALYLHSESWDWFNNQLAPEISFVGRCSSYVDNLASGPPGDTDMGGFGPSFTYTVVPEPGLLALLPLSAAIFYGARRRR